MMHRPSQTPPRPAGTLRVRYRLGVTTRDEGEALARRIALEQTVELPESAIPPALTNLVPGRLTSLEPSPGQGFTAFIEYPAWLAEGGLAQLLNLLFGNISLLDGVVVEDVDWPPSLLHRHPGPRYGMAGLRRLAGVSERRPLLASALKPVGLTPGELAHLAAELARGGVDLVKDDHGLADQDSAPPEERIPRCQEAVERANAATGGHTVYFPNVTGPPQRLWKAVELARSAGCPGVLVAPMLVGLDLGADPARSHGPSVLSPPPPPGGCLRPRHGLDPALLLGRLFRLAGADGVIFPAPGGRFPLFDSATCAALATALRSEWGTVRPAAPVLAGGIDAERVPAMVGAWGPDTVFLVGGSLHAGGDPRGAAERLRAAMEEAVHG